MALDQGEDGQGHRLGAAGDVAGQDDGGAEFTEAAGEGEEQAGQHAAAGQGQGHGQERVQAPGAEAARGQGQARLDAIVKGLFEMVGRFLDDDTPIEGLRDIIDPGWAMTVVATTLNTTREVLTNVLLIVLTMTSVAIWLRNRMRKRFELRTI